MAFKYPPIHSSVSTLLHGADYNPDQWLYDEAVLKEDIRLMKLAKCNVMSVGIFAWSALEPEEGVFTFEWLDKVLDTFAENGIHAFLATPSGARPAWLSEKYPEVLRVQANRQRNLHGLRHNHCLTSPVYREKVRIINEKLADRYSDHPAIIGWHISNEYGGECHCDYCQEAFRSWLKDKYETLDNLNHAWWSAFWSHTITSWSQIQSPAPHGESMVHALNLDWKRFVTAQTVDFFREEIKPIRAVNPELPVTTNFMEAYDGLNYWEFADEIDFVCWDSYPTWHKAGDDADLAAWVGMIHDIKRTMKGGKPFVLMESTPSTTNWQPVSKLKRPGMHLLSSLQAVAHGADSVQYFQWRKSRGASEKFHGAVVDHAGHEHTRVFTDVKQLGEVLAQLTDVRGTSVKPEVALIFDWENRWAIRDAQGPRNQGMHYEDTVKQYYKALWKRGIPVDVIEAKSDFTGYKLLIAPMLYMLKPGVAERIAEFVKAGGIFVATYWTGIVDENDLCITGGVPGNGLREVLGIWSEEIDALYDADENRTIPVDGNAFGFTDTYTAKELCDLIHLEGATAIATYGDDFYAGRPALTVNHYGAGTAYYVASRNEAPFYDDFIGQLVAEHGLATVIQASLPVGVTAQLRTDGETDFIFLMNFTKEEKSVQLDDESFTDVLTSDEVAGQISLPPYGVRVMKRESTQLFSKGSEAHEIDG